MQRRKLLATVGIAALAGCAGSDTEDPNGGSNNSDDKQSGNGGETSTESSELQGPTGEENRQYVDVGYREYTDGEIQQVKNEAEEIAYEDLFRNIESYEGEAVSYEGTVIQNLEDTNYDTLLISLDEYGEDLIYATWTGSRFLQDDVIEIWAEVIGTETYMMGSGAEKTVPALTVADAELVE